MQILKVISNPENVPRAEFCLLTKFKGSKTFRFLAILLSFLFLTVSFLVVSPSPASALISAVKEKKMGEKFLIEAKKHLRFIQDDVVVDYINQVGQHVVDCLQFPVPYTFQFFVLDSPIPNAFAVPGGYIFLDRGIIEMMDSEGEIASVISHEIGHVQARHIARRIERSKYLNAAMIAAMLAGVFLGGVASQALIRGAMATNASVQLGHSRQDEREADHRGMENLVRAGYDPNTMYKAMRKIWKNKWQAGVDIPNYLATHPGLGERLIYIKGLVQVKKPEAQRFVNNQRPGEDMFDFVNAILWGKYHEVSAAKAHFRSLIGRGNQDGPAYFGLALVQEREGKIKKSIISFKKALKAKPGFPLLLASLGRVYFRNGDTKKAIELLDKAISKDKRFREAYYILGRCYEELKDNKKALQNFEKAFDMGFIDPELKYHMGIVYGRLGQLAPAHEYLGFYYADKGKPNITLSLYHLEKALELYGENSTEGEKIRDKISDIKGEKKEERTNHRGGNV